VPNCAAELLTPKELELGIHAGDAETSLLLSILPDQVKMEAAICEYPPLPQDSLLSMEGKLPFAWTTRDLSRSGVLGDPTGATQAKGEQILASLATGWLQVIRDIYRFQQPRAWNE
jgi:creatinine amidohydrolase